MNDKAGVHDLAESVLMAAGATAVLFGLDLVARSRAGAAHASPPTHSALLRVEAALAVLQQTQDTILKELQTMTTTMTTAEASAELAADLLALRKREDGQRAQISSLQETNTALTEQVAALKTAADQHVDQVPSELQAQIDQLHAFAQNAAGDATPAQDVPPASSGEAGAPSAPTEALTDSPAPKPAQEAPVAPAGDDAPSGAEVRL